MKISAIRGKNLASLEGEFEIDFNAEPLKSAGIFAITGSTGSGKSTILDALCLALFDETPRTSRAGENVSILDVKDKTINQKDSRTILRRGTSDGYAEVDFVSLGGENFRATWSVKRARNKVDGSMQNSELRLMNIGSNIEVQGRKTELLTKISELIGLTFEQFTRSVLLAQGDFATFLKAKQSEKAELLEKLTGTDIYSRISVAIFDKSKIAEQNFNALKEKIADIELLSNEEIETLNSEKQNIAEEVKALKVAAEIFTAKIKWLTDEEALKISVKQAQETLDNSQKAIKEANPRYEYVVKIDSVQEIRDDFNTLKSLQKQLAENLSNLDKQKVDRDANAQLLLKAEEGFIASEKEQKELNLLIEKIEPVITKARELDVKIEGAQASVKDAQKELDAAKQSVDRVDRSIQDLEKEIGSMQKAVYSLSKWFDENILYSDIVPRIDLIVNLLDDASIANTQGISNAKLLEDNKAIHENEIKKLEELEQESGRLNSLLPAEIALLRAKLEEGSPCPVCGNLHHPLQGNSSGSSLQEEELNIAKKSIAEDMSALSESIDNRKKEITRLSTLIDSYSKQSSDAIAKVTIILEKIPSWKIEFENGSLQNNLKKIAGQWSKNSADLAIANEAITNKKTTLLNWQENLKEASLIFETRKKGEFEAAQLLVQLQEERKLLLSGKSVNEVSKYFSDKKTEVAGKLKSATDYQNSLINKQEALKAVITQLDNTVIQLKENCALLQKKVENWITSRRVVDSVKSLSELLSNDNTWLISEKQFLATLKELQTTAQATLIERQANLSRHNESEQKPLVEETKESLQSELKEKQSRIDLTTKRNAEVEVAFSNHYKGIERIKVYEKELAEKGTLSENWKKLNELYGSATGSKFKEIAQGYTLDALLTYANKHLKELSKRYELQRIPDTLALQVVDLDMLGEIRTVHSLSGGESFLISLALALGLSSLSSNRMKVESLFIDEGFGSLDIDTLRIAMDALEQLQSQGRKIGVISHVAEMTERITAQVRVFKTANGRSRIEVIES